MVKVIQVKDAASVEPQEVPDVGTFPVALADSGMTETEWRTRIKKEHLPLEVIDVNPGALPKKYEGTLVEEVVGGES